MSDHVYLLTGATGFIGGEVLRNPLLRDGTARVIALVRAGSREEAMKFRLAQPPGKTSAGRKRDAREATFLLS